MKLRQLPEPTQSREIHWGSFRKKNHFSACEIGQVSSLWPIPQVSSKPGTIRGYWFPFSDLLGRSLPSVPTRLHLKVELQLIGIGTFLPFP